MAARIRAIAACRPDFERVTTLQMEQVVELIAMRTGRQTSEVLSMAYELREVLVWAHHAGQAVKIEGLGTFTPLLRASGRLETTFRAEPALKRLLNQSSRWRAKIRNRANLGKSADELVACWNAEHPEDLVPL
jgi:hypothetical protein